MVIQKESPVPKPFPLDGSCGNLNMVYRERFRIRLPDVDGCLGRLYSPPDSLGTDGSVQGNKMIGYG